MDVNFERLRGELIKDFVLASEEFNRLVAGEISLEDMKGMSFEEYIVRSRKLKRIAKEALRNQRGV